MNVLGRVFFSEVLVHCQLYELHCLLCLDRGCFAQRAAVCALQEHFHLARGIGVWSGKGVGWGGEMPASLRVGQIREMWTYCLWKRNDLFWNSLMLLSKCLPSGLLFRSSSSSHKKHLAYVIVLHCFVCFYCQWSNRQYVCFVIHWLSLNCFRNDDDLFQWVIPRKRENRQGVQRVGEKMKRGRTVWTIYIFPAMLWDGFE